MMKNRSHLVWWHPIKVGIQTVETSTPKMYDFREKRNGKQYTLTEKTLTSLETEKKGMPLKWDNT
jgi:hypothetical protein